MKSVIVLFLLTSALMIQAQDRPPQLIDQFFEDYASLTPVEALDNLYSHMPSADRIQDELNQLMTQFEGLQTIVGPYLGHDEITRRGLAERYAIYSYLVRFERQPVRFTFQFYRPDKTWQLYSFSYDDNIDDEMEAAIRLDMLEFTKRLGN